MPEHAHGVIYTAYLKYMRVAARQDPDRDWLERELGAPKEWVAREPEARVADEIARLQRLRHEQAGDSLYAIANPHDVFFCDSCWTDDHVRVAARWADTDTRQLCCPSHTSLAAWGDAATAGNDPIGDANKAEQRYADLFGNEDAASDAFDDEVARRFALLNQLEEAGSDEKRDWAARNAEHDWAMMDGAYDSLPARPFFNPELAGVAYPLPPEGIGCLLAQ